MQRTEAWFQGEQIYQMQRTKAVEITKTTERGGESVVIVLKQF
jgi:hypothetical protein